MSASGDTLPDAAAFEDRVLALLVEGGTLDRDTVARARRAHQRAGGSITDVLVRLGLCEEKVLARTIADVLHLELFDPRRVPDAAIDIGSLSIPFLRDAKVLPVAHAADAVVLAAVDPSDAFTTRALALALGKPVRFVVATASQIDDGIQRLHALVPQSAGQLGAAALSLVDVADTDVAHLRESASEAPIVRFVERLLAKAIDAGASDIHIEPMERHLRVRLRIDGVLSEEDAVAPSSTAGIVSRIKILARLDIAERRLPQDGAIKANIRGREIDLRVATAPTAHGEIVVIRVLDKGAVKLDLAELGFGPALLAGLTQLLERPNGILLVTGPTGSGKSTTLYAALNRLNTSGRKIITVEDPVEYKIEGLNQIQVKPDIGLDFARSLRSILRHDPDIVMIGEIRDGETARIAMQSALTGHLVLSTLHTNDAASAPTRLLDMGIENYLIASTVTGVLAQRLVRTLCKACRVPAALPAAIKVDQHLARAADVFAAAGCAACRGTGYRGRMLIGELMLLTPKIRRGVLEQQASGRLRGLAIEDGMETLYQNGLRAVMAGRTSLNEVLRVVQDGDE